MAYKQKTWQQKLHNGLKQKIERTVKKFADVPEGVTMLIGTPEMVDSYIKDIPMGTHSSLQQMRKDLAAEHGAEYSCPVVAGICLRIAAEAAYEAYVAGTPVEEIAPFWRMVDSKAPVAKKLTFGTDFVKEQRMKEGLPY